MINNVGQTIRNICLDVLQRKCNYSAWFSDSPSRMVIFGLDNVCQVFKKWKVKQDSVFSVKLSFGIRTELRVQNMRPKDTLHLAWEGVRYLRREDPHLHPYIIVKGGWQTWLLALGTWDRAGFERLDIQDLQVEGDFDTKQIYQISPINWKNPWWWDLLSSKQISNPRLTNQYGMVRVGVLRPLLTQRGRGGGHRSPCSPPSIVSLVAARSGIILMRGKIRFWPQHWQIS